MKKLYERYLSEQLSVDGILFLCRNYFEVLFTNKENLEIYNYLVLVVMWVDVMKNVLKQLFFVILKYVDRYQEKG